MLLIFPISIEPNQQVLSETARGARIRLPQTCSPLLPFWRKVSELGFVFERASASVRRVRSAPRRRQVCCCCRETWLFSSRMSPGWNGEEGGRKEGITGTTPLGKLLQARTLLGAPICGLFVWTGKIHLRVCIFLLSRGAFYVDIVMEDKLAFKSPPISCTM